MERIKFNYQGVMLEAEGYTDSDEDPYLRIEAVYHRGEDLTELFNSHEISCMEVSLNKEVTEEELAAKAMLKWESEDD